MKSRLKILSLFKKKINKFLKKLNLISVIIKYILIWIDDTPVISKKGLIIGAEY